MPSDAKWQEIAVEVHLKFPAYQAIPPKHACFLTASQISEGINLARIHRRTSIDPMHTPYSVVIEHLGSDGALV